jgi:DNA polymerase III alpha subunit
MDYRLSRTGDAFIPKLADFSKGDADVLRKAMGKKQKMSLIK